MLDHMLQGPSVPILQRKIGKPHPHNDFVNHGCGWIKTGVPSLDMEQSSFDKSRAHENRLFLA